MGHTGPLDKQILEDHEEMREYMSSYDEAMTGGDHIKAEEWLHQFVYEVVRHQIAEELVLYPAMEEHLGQKGAHYAANSRRDHQKLDELLQALERLTFGTTEHGILVSSVRNHLWDHLNEEETHDLPLLREGLSDEVREALGRRFAQCKKFLPTRPHPLLPNDSPILEFAMALLLTPIDKLRDQFRSFPKE